MTKNNLSKNKTLRTAHVDVIVEEDNEHDLMEEELAKINLGENSMKKANDIRQQSTFVDKSSDRILQNDDKGTGGVS